MASIFVTSGVALLTFVVGLAAGLYYHESQKRPQGQRATFQSLEELAPLPRIDVTDGQVPAFGKPELRLYQGTTSATFAEKNFYGKDWAWPERIWCAVGKHDLVDGQRYCAIPILNATAGGEIAICDKHMEVADEEANDA